MNWVLLLLSAIVFVEIFFRLKAAARIRELQTIAAKITNTIRSRRISDRWKEKVLPRYAKLLFLQSLAMFFILIGSFSVFYLVWALSLLFDWNFIETGLSVPGLIVSTAAAAAWAMILSQRSVKEYGTLARILHHIALGSPVVGEAAFDIEKIMFRPEIRDACLDQHIFITGLARSGTSVLLQALYHANEFCSLTYRDMPFTLAPNIWRTITGSSPVHKKAMERPHGDGLKIDYDSPEALEEIFWRVFCGPDYIKPQCLIPMDADDETIEKFRSYIALILKNSPHKRYLSKNNNNILRLQSITRAFPHAKIIIPFRDPIQQAYSLLNQHSNFLQQHQSDPFSKKYMKWLAHHEFGENHLPFLFNGDQACQGDTASLAYWLELWINTYSYIKETLPCQVVLLNYERLCDDEAFVWKKLSEAIGLFSYEKTVTFSKSTHPVEEDLPSSRINRAYEIFHALVPLSIGYR